MKRTLEDIRENLSFVGCDNETALEMCAEIERLRAERDEWRAKAKAGSAVIRMYRRKPPRIVDDPTV
jgi:hypothetical protein